jgi:hypothetical protein
MPVIFVPTPPKYFFLPRVVTLLPSWAPLPHTLHCRAIAHLKSTKADILAGVENPQV